MALADVDDLAAIFFGDDPQRVNPAPAGEPLQRESQTYPCESCESCESQALARVCGRFGGCECLRKVANHGPTTTDHSQTFAEIRSHSQSQNRATAQQVRGFSQDSQDSQGSEAKSTATPTTPTTKASPAPDSLALVAWSDADIARFTSRRDRLTRWGYPTTDAEALAERLTLRDRSGDERVSCTECAHYRPGRCSNHRAARLHSPEVGSDLAALLQRCPGFQTAR